MGSDRDIQQTIQILSGTHLADKVHAVDATVISVDEKQRTCVVQAINGKANNTFTARLMATIDDGVLVIPAIDSTVGVIMSDFTVPYISQYSEVDRIILRGGEFGGLVKIIELTEKLNTLVNGINAELPKIAAGILAGGGSYTPTLQETFKKSDYENEAIKHG